MSGATFTVNATAAQLARWRRAGNSDLAAFLARAADFYAARLQARRELALRLRAEGKL